MGKKRCRPSVIVPYHAYHFKDMFHEFDFVCLGDINTADLLASLSRSYKLMILNYSTSWIRSIENEDYPCGTIKCWWIKVGDVTFLEKSDYTKNVIKLAKLMTL